MKKNSKTWFTLIELLVSISILSIVMISIFTIFQLASEANNRTDISRAMQENIKNMVETRILYTPWEYHPVYKEFSRIGYTMLYINGTKISCIEQWREHKPL